MVEVLVDNNLEAVGLWDHQVTLEVGKIRNRAEYESRVVERAAEEDPNQEHHLEVLSVMLHLGIRI